MKRKFCISIDDDLMIKADKYCDERNISTSAFIQTAIHDYLKAHEALPEFKAVLSDGLKAIADYLKGDISKDEFGLRLDKSESDLKSLQKELNV